MLCVSECVSVCVVCVGVCVVCGVDGVCVGLVWCVWVCVVRERERCVV